MGNVTAHLGVKTCRKSKDTSKAKSPLGSAELMDKTNIGKSTPDEKKQVTIGSLDNLDSCDDVGAEPVDKDEGQMQPQSTWLYTSGRFQNGIVGLNNNGLTCCVNAVLQSFYLTPEFTSLLQRLDQTEAVIDLRNVPYVMYQLFDKMQSSVSSVQSVERFLKCLSLNHVKAYRQHDAAELFLSIFNFLMDQFQSQEMAKELKELYEIKMEQFVNCECGEVIVKDTSLLILPLPMQNSRHGGYFMLEDVLQDFFKPQDLSRNNQWLCPFCVRRMPAQQGFRLVSVPEILNLHLNRFYTSFSPYGYTNKIYASLKFPENLNLNQLPISEKTQKCGNGQECWLYQLYAVVAHEGFASFGHYTIFVKSFKDFKWYHINDSCVCQGCMLYAVHPIIMTMCKLREMNSQRDLGVLLHQSLEVNMQVNWGDIEQTFGCRDSPWDETAYMLLYKRVKQKGEKSPLPADSKRQ